MVVKGTPSLRAGTDIYLESSDMNPKLTGAEEQHPKRSRAIAISSTKPDQ